MGNSKSITYHEEIVDFDWEDSDILQTLRGLGEYMDTPEFEERYYGPPAPAHIVCSPRFYERLKEVGWIRD